MRACCWSMMAWARPCSVAETAPVRGLRFFTRVAAVHLRQTMTGWLRLRRS
jgi:hypothetical protein